MLALFAPACGDNAALVPSPTLERPVAVGFACSDAAGAMLDVARCQSGGNTLWALIANSVRGEVALADVSTPGSGSRIRDLDPINPGFQMLSVGRGIADIAVSSGVIGGRPSPVVAITANAGSCDFGLIDVVELVSGDAPVANAIMPVLGGAPMHARPQAVSFVPGKVTEVYATFPGCGLLARIDLATGEVLQALQILSDGRAELAQAPSCPIECGASADPCPAGGCLSTALPADLDVADDGSLLVVSSAAASFVTVVVLDRDGAMSYVRVVPLEGEAATGKVRISPLTENFGRFAYVAARDGSVRVVSLSEFRECETNADLGADPTLGASGCAPIGSPRRALARGPGIGLARPGREDVALPGDRVVLPVDVAFAALGPSGEEGPAHGVFAFVLGSDGLVVVVDVEDPAYPDAVPHTLRSGFPRIEPPLVGEIDSEGTRVVRAPSRVFGGQAAPGHRYPVLQPTSDDAEDVGVRFSAPLGAAPSDQVTLTFEGVLGATRRAQGVIDFCQGNEGPVCLRDPGAAFCARGVEAGDLLELVACSEDSQCRTGIEVCYHDPSAAIEEGGLCVCGEGAAPEDRCTDRDQCRALLTSRREYLIAVARFDELELEPVDPMSDTAPLDPSCLRSVRYQVRAANALLVHSAAVGTTHGVVVDGDGTCVREGGVQAKIALDPPPCVDSAVPDPNPCRTRDLVRARHPLYDFTLGRAEDTEGLSAIPRQTFQIFFDVAGSFVPLSPDSQAYLPAAIELAPDGLLYFVDQGDAINRNIRGRLTRMDPRDAEIEDPDEFSVF